MLRKRKTLKTIQSTLEASLSFQLADEHSVHSMPIRKGDTITVTRGAYRDVEGKVTQIDHKKGLVYVEGVTKEKPDGNTIFLPIHPSKVIITKLNLEDKWRGDILERRASRALIETIERPTISARKRSSKKTASGVEKKEGKE